MFCAVGNSKTSGDYSSYTFMSPQEKRSNGLKSNTAVVWFVLDQQWMPMLPQL